MVSLSSSDGRQRNYELSAEGKRALERLRERRQHAITEVWLEFDAASLGAFTRFGNELIERLERYSEDLASVEARRGLSNGKDAVREGV